MGYTTTFSGGIRFNIDISDSTAKILTDQFVDWEIERFCYCPWFIKKDHRGIWILKCEDGKSKEYLGWLKIILYKLSKIYSLNGSVFWRGEDYSDNGKLVVENNILTVYKTKYVNEMYC